MHRIKIGKKNVGEGFPCFIIAEAGSNHNGSLSMAKELIDAAADAGADAVKFQVFRAKAMYPDKNIRVKYLQDMGIKDNLYNTIKKFEVPYEWIEKLCAYSKKQNIDFMATPFDLEAVKLLNPYVNAFKIASYECMFLDLIKAVKATGKPLLISTGGSKEEEIDMLVRDVLADCKDRTVLFHCIAKYPAPPEETCLRTMPYLRNKYGLNIGYSDHTEDAITAATAAVVLGAVIIEKHFTLSKKLSGPDHSFAVEPAGLKSMVKAIRMTEKVILPVEERRLKNCEKELYFYKRCLYYKRKLPKGHTIEEDDIMVLRNIGKKCDYFNPMEIDKILGKRLRKTKNRDEIITREDIS